jgi:hypothetical protein
MRRYHEISEFNSSSRTNMANTKLAESQDFKRLASSPASGYSLLLAGALHVYLLNTPKHLGRSFWALWRGWSLQVVAAGRQQPTDF